MNSRRIRAISLVIAVALITGACKKDSSANDTVNPPVGTVDDNAGFYLHYRADAKYSYNMHRGDTTFDNDCKANANEDVSCFLEVPEGDIYFHGVTLQYNVPSSLCSYVVFSPYYYSQYQIGTGPTKIQIDTDKNGAVGLDDGSNGGTANDGIVDNTNVVTTCAFDYTQNNGPNCCFGTYTNIQRVWTVVAGAPAGYVVTSTPNLSWGGSFPPCVAGPATDTQTKDKDGLPRADLMYVEGAGLNKNYKIEAPIQKDKATNIYAANFYIPAEHGGTAPVALRSVTAGGRTFAPNNFYTVTCYDRAMETVSRISLMIREWNTKAAYDNRRTAPANHSLGNAFCGLTGFPACTAADFEPAPFNTQKLNDFGDWLDWANFFPQGSD